MCKYLLIEKSLILLFFFKLKFFHFLVLPLNRGWVLFKKVCPTSVTMARLEGCITLLSTQWALLLTSRLSK